MFSDQEKNDLIRVLDEYLDSNWEDYLFESNHDNILAWNDFRTYFRRVAILFYVFTASDWTSPTEHTVTVGGRPLI